MAVIEGEDFLNSPYKNEDAPVVTGELDPQVSEMQVEATAEQKIRKKSGTVKKVMAVICAAVVLGTVATGVFHGLKYWGNSGEIHTTPGGEGKVEPGPGEKDPPVTPEKEEENNIFRQELNEDETMYVVTYLEEKDGKYFFREVGYKDVKNASEFDERRKADTLEVAKDSFGEYDYRYEVVPIQSGDETLYAPVYSAKEANERRKDVKDIQKDSSSKANAATIDNERSR